MSAANLEGARIVEAVFSVCLPAELSGCVAEAVESVDGAQFAGEFQEYITSGKKPQFPATIQNAPVCVALIDCDIDREAALETMRNLQHLLPGKSRVIAVSENADAPFLMCAIRAGCSEVLSKPLPATELVSALRRFHAIGNPDAVRPQHVGKTIALMGSKGGVGTSTLAVHLAVHLARTHGKRVLLVDQKHQLGHLALYLGINQPKYYFSELLQNADRLDAQLLEGLITRHSAGLDVIASPQICTPRYEIRTGTASSVVNFLRQRYDFVLLDLESECSEWLNDLLRCCDQVEMVCTPDVASLRDAARHIEHLSLAEGFASKLRVVMNRADAEPTIPQSDVERVTRFPVGVEIPNNCIELAKTINTGQPIPATAKGKFTQALSKWAKNLATDPASGSLHASPMKGFRLWR